MRCSHASAAFLVQKAHTGLMQRCYDVELIIVSMYISSYLRIFILSRLPWSNVHRWRRGWVWGVCDAAESVAMVRSHSYYIAWSISLTLFMQMFCLHCCSPQASYCCAWPRLAHEWCAPFSGQLHLHANVLKQVSVRSGTHQSTCFTC